MTRPHPGDGGGWPLPRLFGESKAVSHLLTDRDTDAEETVDLGLAVEAADDPLAAGTDLADELLDLSGLPSGGRRRSSKRSRVRGLI